MTAKNGRTTTEGYLRAAEPHRPVWRVLLLAATAIEEDGRGVWSPGDLAVEAARIDPQRFCLKSATGAIYNHPDVNRVIVELVKNKRTNLLGRGWAERIGVSVYRLTDAGREAARAGPT